MSTNISSFLINVRKLNNIYTINNRQTTYLNNSILGQRQQLPDALHRRTMSLPDLLLQLLHKVLVMLPVVIVAAVGQSGVDQSGKHVDHSGEEVATTQTILIYCRYTVCQAIFVSDESVGASSTVIG